MNESGGIPTFSYKATIASSGKSISSLPSRMVGVTGSYKS